MIQKGIDRQVVLYWYQGRGRVIANEYANKLWLMVDAARLHRTNGSLVRIVVPVRAATGGSVGADDAAPISPAPSIPTFPPICHEAISFLCRCGDGCDRCLQS